MSELISSKGASTCHKDEKSEQVPSTLMHDDAVLSSNVWAATRNTANNAWYVNAGNGNLNNTNTNNRYAVVGSVDYEDINWMLFIIAERNCYKNKHHSHEAARFHFSASRLKKLYETVMRGEYIPHPGICFVLDYPVFREVFAAAYEDRNIHHFVAPLLERVAESVHNANGDRSHGNRTGHSTLTASEQIRGYMKIGEYVATFDVSGFFTHIDRSRAIKAWEEYSREFISDDVSRLQDRLIHILLKECSHRNAVRRSPASAWNNIPPHKSIFGIDERLGLPIGNFYSQLIANLYLASVDKSLFDAGIKHTRFVDDICVVGPLSDIRKARKIIRRETELLGLRLNDRKCYIQPCSRGVKFCGRVIRHNRIRISTRTKKACERAIRESGRDAESAVALKNTINSYFGIMSKAAEFNEQRRLMSMATEKLGDKIKFRAKGNQLVCSMQPRYDAKYQSITFIKSFSNEIGKITRRADGARRSGTRHRSRRGAK